MKRGERRKMTCSLRLLAIVLMTEQRKLTKPTCTWVVVIGFSFGFFLVFCGLVWYVSYTVLKG